MKRAVMRRRRKREARWEAVRVMEHDKALVVVRKVTRSGCRSVVLDQQFVGSVAMHRPDYLAELTQMELDATTRAIQLNAGAVT